MTQIVVSISSFVHKYLISVANTEKVRRISWNHTANFFFRTVLVTVAEHSPESDSPRLRLHASNSKHASTHQALRRHVRLATIRPALLRLSARACAATAAASARHARQKQL